MPEFGLREKPEIVLSILFTTNRKAPVGSAATPKGCWPTAAVEIPDKLPLLMLNVETVPAATLVAKRKRSMGSTVRRNGLLWQEVPHDGAGAGNADAGVSAPVLLLICRDTTDSAM